MKSKVEITKNIIAIEMENPDIAESGISYPDKYNQGWYRALLWVMDIQP